MVKLSDGKSPGGNLPKAVSTQLSGGVENYLNTSARVKRQNGFVLRGATHLGLPRS